MLLERTRKLRTDYPLIALLRGHLYLIDGNSDDARAAYEEYLRLNRYQFERALVRQVRILKRMGEPLEEGLIRQARDDFKSDQGGLTTPFLWSYLSLDLDGIAMPHPADQTTYFNLGVCDLRAGSPEVAEQRWEAMTHLVPDHADGWANLGTLQASQGRLDEARVNWQRALALEPDHAFVLQAQRQLEAGPLDSATVRYAPIEIVLPITRKRL